jgi:hypothetical protein
MLLGPANVRATRKDGRYKVKEEYNAYRVGFILMFTVICVGLQVGNYLPRKWRHFKKKPEKS